MTANKRLISVTAAEVTPETPRFAWAGRIPLGCVTVVAGPPGHGKTQLLIGACSRLTRGKLEGDLAGQPVDALFISMEDSIEHTLSPRAIAAGGDLRRLHFLRGVDVNAEWGDDERAGIEIPNDLPALDDWLKERRARFVVVDPIMAALPPQLNAHRDQHVRRALAPLAKIAEERDAAIVIVMHLNKSQEHDALNRLSGSIGFGGAARSVLLFALDPDDPLGEAGDRRVLAHVKCNVGPRQRSIAYRIEPRELQTANGLVKTSIAIRDGNAIVSANDLLGNPTSSSEATARTEARDFLTLELASGPVPTSDLRTRAEDAGLNWRTVERAKQQLGIRARKQGATWAWELSTPSITPPVGLDGLVGVDGGKTDNSDNSDSEENVADLDPDAEHDRLALKFGEDQDAA